MIFDLHNDLLTSGFELSHIKSIIKNNPNKVVYAFFTSKLSGNIFNIVLSTYNKIKKNLGDNYIAIEDMHFITPQTLERLSEVPLLYCGLTWNDENCIAGGAFSSTGLTAFGKIVIDKLNQQDILVDTAHLNEKSFDQVVDCSKSIINSHTAIWDIKHHARNLKMRQIKQIIKRGGVIGITPVSDFLGGNGRVSDYIKHLDYFMQRFGADNICIGTDFYGTTPLDSLNNYESFDIIELGLGKLGYAPIITQKLFYQNAEKFFINRRK